MEKNLFYNGNIYTMDGKNPVVDNILVSGSKIIDLNSAESGNIKKIDLEGATLLPGFNDSHMHILSYGVSLDMVDLNEVTSIKELKKKVREYIEKKDIAPGEWVFGRGWNHENFREHRMPNRNDIDGISTRYPIALTRTCGHIVSVNSTALAVAGVDGSTTVKGGRIYKDKDGIPTGIMTEKAKDIIYRNRPEMSVSDIKKYLLLAGKKLRKFGLTTVQSDDLQAVNTDYRNVLQAYYELSDNRQMPVKVNMQLKFKTAEEVNEFVLANPIRQYSDYLTLGPLKIIADGSLGGRTAAMREPFSDDNSTCGELTFSPRRLEQLIVCALDHNMQTAFHAIGDRAIELYLDIMEKLQTKYGSKFRNRVIHCQITDYELIQRMKKLKIHADVQPAFTATDWKIVKNRVGEKRALNTYAWKTLMDMGINVAGGSDCPIETPDPLWGIRCAVTRLDRDNKPENGWHPWEKVTVYDAIKMYTHNSAYSVFAESRKGTIRKGYEADLVILDRDPFRVKPENISEINVLGTVVNGHITWNKKKGDNYDN